MIEMRAMSTPDLQAYTRLCSTVLTAPLMFMQVGHAAGQSSLAGAGIAAPALTCIGNALLVPRALRLCNGMFLTATTWGTAGAWLVMAASLGGRQVLSQRHQPLRSYKPPSGSSVKRLFRHIDMQGFSQKLRAGSECSGAIIKSWLSQDCKEHQLSTHAHTTSGRHAQHRYMAHSLVCSLATGRHAGVGCLFRVHCAASRVRLAG